MDLYKVTNPDGAPCNGGSGAWSLPTLNADGTWTPGEWREVDGPLDPCRRGLHLATRKTLLDWIGPAIWAAEVEGETIDAGDKVVARKVRLVRGFPQWNEQSARIFAVECAESVLHLARAEDRPTLEVALYVARCYADGEATRNDLAAAWSAAWTAAGDAAWAAAGDAVKAAARAAAGDAAWAAARAAARVAAWSAAWAAAGDAAWAAAGDAVKAAASGRLMALLES